MTITAQMHTGHRVSAARVAEITLGKRCVRCEHRTYLNVTIVPEVQNTYTMFQCVCCICWLLLPRQISLSRSGQPYKSCTGCPQRCSFRRISRFLRWVELDERVVALHAEVYVVVVIKATLSVKTAVRRHKRQTLSTALHRLRHMEYFVRCKVEELHKDGVLVPKEVGACDEPGAEGIHSHGRPLRGQSALQFLGKQHVAELGVLVSLVRVELRSVNHVEQRSLGSKAAQVAEARRRPNLSARASRIMNFGRGDHNASPGRALQILQKQIREEEVPKVVRSDC
mmetsp:Transcript_1163/g.2058  ORF Transcript_1163/g.2058 Transcript_1163/m.2058 type:complete len:283 (+) Transcript_1163:2-850(+)